MKCDAKGLPDPQVTWSRNGRLIKNQTLVLGQVTKDDSGLYLCKAYNAAGEDSVEVNVTVDDTQESIQNTGKKTDKTIFCVPLFLCQKTYLIDGIVKIMVRFC